MIRRDEPSRAGLAWALAAAWCAAGCGHAVAVGGDFGKFALRDTSGDSHASAVLLSRGALLVLYVWSAECESSARVDPAIVALHAAHAPRGVEFLGLDPVRADEPAGIAAAAGDRDIPFPIVRDPGGVVTRRLGARHFPVAGIVDRARILRWRGPVSHLEGAIEAVLRGAPIVPGELPESGCVSR